MMRTFVHRSRLAAPAAEVFAWHERRGALERLTPPWERVRVLHRTGGIRDGDRVTLRATAGPFRTTMAVEHSGYIQGRRFQDTQISGPFRRWLHTHSFEPDGPDASFLEDRIEWELPFGSPAESVLGPRIEERLARMFEYRHRTTREDVAFHLLKPGVSSLSILVSGSTGLVGSSLVPFLTTGGHRVVRLARARSKETVFWNPATGEIEEDALEGFDAVVHLAGENIGAGRWTAARKRRIVESRTGGTRLLCEALARRKRPPRVIISAAATGFYGDRGDSPVDEGSAPGRGFLADLCREWEAATKPAEEAGIRVVHLRAGVVLTPAGGVLGKILLPFRLGMGGRLGGGRQYMSWISIDDLISLFLHAIREEAIAGPLNATAPGLVTNREFTGALGRVLGRPTPIPVPAAALRILFGQMAQETILSGARVIPRLAAESGYRFRDPDLEGALRRLFGKMSRPRT